MKLSNEVTYTSHKEHKGFDITIHEMKRGDYIADVTSRDGERLYGWELLKSFNCALMKAVGFIDSMEWRGVIA